MQCFYRTKLTSRAAEPKPGAPELGILTAAGAQIRSRSSV